MTTYYVESSALAKRYVDEAGSRRVRALAEPDAGHVLVTARVTTVEIHSAVARRRREGSVADAACAIALRALTDHALNEYDFVELDGDVIARARDLLDRRPLRAYDAVQLASALSAQSALSAALLGSLVFVSADSRLAAAAMAEGLAVDDLST